MKITFVLPGGARNPSGGFKIVYEYANHLSRAGHKITLIHLAYVGSAIERHPASSFRRALSRYISRLLTFRWKPGRWFTLDSNIDSRWVPLIHPAFIPDADVIVATLWLTAEQVHKLPDSKGNKFYLVQGIETWGGADERVRETWKLPLKKISISKWIQTELRKEGVESTYIPNGLDFEKFGIDTPISERNPAHVSMLYSSLPVKGSNDGIAALVTARQMNPAITAEAFGVPPRPECLPEWISYRQTPTQSELRATYNRSALFIAPSLSEGWGLTASEAMQCGAAVIATRIGGHEEFCTHMETAILCEPGNVAELADAITLLSQDHALREKLSAQGHASIARFTWESSVDRLLQAMSA